MSVAYHMKFSEIRDGRNPFGFKKGFDNPYIEGSGADPAPDYEPTVKTIRLIMGYLTATESLATLNITTCKRHIYHMKQN
jgi:hypothetical protein